MLIVFETEAHQKKAQEEGLNLSGLTPPTTNIVKRKFEKTKKRAAFPKEEVARVEEDLVKLMQGGVVEDIRTSIVESESALSQMTTLDFKMNLLAGSVPRFYADLTNLQDLQLQGNSITGEITTYMCAGWNHKKVVADCDDLVRCYCCSKCCVDGEECVDVEGYVPSDGVDNGFFGPP